jgi:phage gpG-like protein
MITLTGDAALQDKLNRLSTVMRTKLLEKLGNAVVGFSKQHIDAQIDLSNSAFKARKSKSNKKMLLGLKARLRVLSVTNNGVVIGFDDHKTAQIAAAQQFGQTTTFTATQNKQVGGINAVMASSRQAKTLLDLGYRVGKRKPTMNEIMTKYTISKAGFLIHKLREAQGITTKSSWDIVIPARSFLGVTDNDKQALQQMIIDAINQEISQ